MAQSAAQKAAFQKMIAARHGSKAKAANEEQGEVPGAPDPDDAMPTRNMKQHATKRPGAK